MQQLNWNDKTHLAFFPKMFGPSLPKMERTTGYTKTSSPTPPFLNNNLSHENQRQHEKLWHIHTSPEAKTLNIHTCGCLFAKIVWTLPLKKMKLLGYTKQNWWNSKTFVTSSGPDLGSGENLPWPGEMRNKLKHRNIILSVGAVDDSLGIIL